MSNTITDDAFRADIEATRSSTSMLIYADFVEEAMHKPDMAFALRWMAERGKYPCDRKKLTASSSEYRGIVQQYRFAWWPERRIVVHNAKWPERMASYAELPRIVFFSLRGAEYYDVHRYYKSFWLAVEELSRGLRLMRDLLAGHGDVSPQVDQT